MGCQCLFPGFSSAGVVNPRKRGREAAVSGGPANIFSFQPYNQSPTLVNLSQLHNQDQGVVSTGLRLSLEEQQKQHHHRHQQQQQLGVLLSSPVLSSSSLIEDISAQIKHQRDEIDQILQTQVPKFPNLFRVLTLL